MIRRFVMALKEVSSKKCFDGFQKVFEHESEECKGTMKFGIYFPPQAEEKKCPVLYYLSGLTCTEQNVVGKGGTQGPASKQGIVIVAPDTSPTTVTRVFKSLDKCVVPIGKVLCGDLLFMAFLSTSKYIETPRAGGCNIEGEDDSYDFGSGAGFYVDATEPKWKTNYRMYSYITKELPQVIASNFSDKVDQDKSSVFGHSMGGHGALICALKNPGKYKSVSAFAPIVNPIQCPWGQKALPGYLGDNKDLHKEYDACELVRKYKGPKLDILIDQGTCDEFLERELLPDHFVRACADVAMPLNLRFQKGYDHSYFTISTFMEDHINHHAKYLNN